MSPSDRRLDSIPEDAFVANITTAVVAALVPALAASNAAAGAATRDPFGRERVSLPYQEVDLKFTHDLSPGTMSVFKAGTGDVVHVAGDSYAKLSVAASGDRAILRTRVPQRYRAGQGLLIIPTSIVESPDAANVVHRIGYLNDSDGVFLKISNGVTSFIVRDSIQSTETEILQSAWNKDKFDGTGDSGVTIDWSKSILMVIDLQYLGIGQIRWGFEFGGSIIWAHWQDYSNVSSTGPYMASANLHLCWEIEATGVPAATTNLRAICGTVIREGGNEEPTDHQVAARPVVTPAEAPASQAWTSVVSVRVKDLHKETGSALPSQINVYTVDTEDLAWRVLRLPFDDVPAGITNWADAGDESICEMSLDVTTVDITKGKTYGSGEISGGTNAAPGAPVVTGIFDASALGLTDDSGTVGISYEQDVMVLCVAKLDNAGTADVFGSIQIHEVR